MKQQISEFENSRTALEKVLNSSNVQLSKQVAQLAKKNAKFTGAARVARSKKKILSADIAQKPTAAKKDRLAKLVESMRAAAVEARVIGGELKAAKAELKELKATASRYKAGFKAFDKASKVAKATPKRRVKRKAVAKK
jgi:hypothetical protein